MYRTAPCNAVCCKENFLLKWSCLSHWGDATSNLIPAIRPLQQNVYKRGNCKVPHIHKFRVGVSKYRPCVWTVTKHSFMNY